MKLLLGTTKGLITLASYEGTWKVERVNFLGLPVSMIHQQQDDGRLWLALASKHWGVKLHTSQDGINWSEVTVPKYQSGDEITKGEQAHLKLIWSMAGDSSELWIGTDPGGLFRSKLGGEFQLVRPLWDHPSRPQHWFGGGRNNPGIHSICVNPDDRNQIAVGISCAGVFQTEDGGCSWQPTNKGLRAEYLPNPYPDVGHDPHSLKQCQSVPNVFWQQNHCGVFRSDNHGQSWQDVTSKDGFGSYGFAMVIDDYDPQRAWIVPAESDERRVAKNLRLTICSTQDGGLHWSKHHLTPENLQCFDLVFRHALDRQSECLALATTNGNLLVSSDNGKTYSLIHHHLPPVHVVKIVDR